MELLNLSDGAPLPPPHTEHADPDSPPLHGHIDPLVLLEEEEVPPSPDEQTRPVIEGAETEGPSREPERIRRGCVGAPMRGNP